MREKAVKGEVRCLGNEDGVRKGNEGDMGGTGVRVRVFAMVNQERMRMRKWA